MSTHLGVGGFLAKVPRLTPAKVVAMLAAMLGAAVALGLGASAASAATFSNEDGITINTASTGAIFCSDDTPAKATPYPSQIAVSGLGSVSDVNVSVSGLSHTFSDDVGLLLVSPAGQSTLLMTDSGGRNAASGINLTFDDAASGPLPDNTQISSGTYKPSQGTSDFSVDGCPAPASFPDAPAGPYGSTLSVFNGTNPNGTWQLYVIDDTSGDAGSITGWSLDISTSTPADTTPPTLSVTHTADGTSGWNKTSPVTVNVSASDSDSGLAGDPTCTDGTTDLPLTAGTAGDWTASISGEGTHAIECFVSDEAGNTTNATDTVNIDTTAPTISDLGPTTTANANGWFNTDVTNRFQATDSGSGLSAACLASFTDTGNTQSKSTSGEGTALKVTSDSCTDVAGNTAAGIDSATFNIDKSAPSVSCSVSPSTLRVPANNHKLVSIKATVTVTDNTGDSGANGFTLLSVTSNQPQSGLASDDVPNDIQGWTTGTADTSGQVRAERYGTARTYTLTYQGKDLAGNTSSNCQATVTVPKGG